MMGSIATLHMILFEKGGPSIADQQKTGPSGDLTLPQRDVYRRNIVIVPLARSHHSMLLGVQEGRQFTSCAFWFILIHPGKLAWKPNMEVWKMIFLFN